MTTRAPTAVGAPAAATLGAQSRVAGGAADRWWTSTALIVAVAALVRVAALLLFEGDAHDGMTRIGTATDWLVLGDPMFGRTVWPEGNYLLPAAAISVWGDAFWSVRVLYLLVCLTNVWLAVRLTRAMFDPRAAAAAGWVLALLPYHILVSANSAMAEGPYLSLMLVALWCVVEYRRAPAVRYAVGAGLALTAAATFRVDGVVWGIPLAASFVLLRGDERKWPSARTIRDLAIFGVLGLLYPVLLFAQWSRLYDSPWFILDQAKLNTLQFFGGGTHSRWPAWLYQTYTLIFWPASTFLVLTPVIAALGWTGALVAARRQLARALPVLLGLLTTVVWLAYASSRHSILTQFRYTLILAALLALFVAPGARAIAGWSPRLSPPRLAAAAAVGAVLWQGAVTAVAVGEYGVASRQLATVNLFRPAQFATRPVLDFARQWATPSAPVLLTPHVVAWSPYLTMHRVPLEKAGKVVAPGYYVPGSQLVHTRASLAQDLSERIRRARWVVTTARTTGLGLQDGMVSELVAPVCTGGAYRWRDVALRRLQRWDDIQLWEVVGAGAPASANPAPGAGC